jgi:flavin reductase (DIM6/NTAB) family NADH-FMN oxidoreductase RutF
MGIADAAGGMSMDAAVAEPGFDPREFRSALGQFATGVTVVTAPDGKGGYVGTTASSFNSVSVDPPLILWSIDNGARSLPAYEKAKYFVVNIHAADQVTLSNHFARQQPDKFVGVDFDLNAQGVPALRDCSAWFHCKTRYSISDAHPAAAVPNQEESDTGERSFAENYLHYLVGRCFHQLIDKLDRMLEKRDITQHEYRVLASFSGLSGADLATLVYYTLLSPEELRAVFSGLSGTTSTRVRM